MHVSDLDLGRLAVRIEGMVHTNFVHWHPADELDFKRMMATLPDPRDLRRPWSRCEGGTTELVSLQQYRTWVGTLRDMEDLKSANQSGSHRKVVRDVRRGNFQDPATIAVLIGLGVIAGENRGGGG